MEDKLQIFLSCLKLNRKVIGVKFLFDEQEYENADSKASKTKLSYCMMVKIATSGKSIKVRSEHFWCSSSARVFGIRNVEETVKSGREYLSYGVYNSLSTARKTFQDMTYLNHKVYGLELKPIEEFIDKPNIVIAISEPYNIMRIIQGYTYEYGFAENIKFAGNQGVCSDLTARPYMNDDINISLLCSNTRYSCKWNDGEMGVGMPYNIFEKVMNGVLNTMNHVEPDYKKDEILRKVGEKGLNIEVKKGENYYDSCLGVAKLD